MEEGGRENRGEGGREREEGKWKMERGGPPISEVC